MALHKTILSPLLLLKICCIGFTQQSFPFFLPNNSFGLLLVHSCHIIMYNPDKYDKSKVFSIVLNVKVIRKDVIMSPKESNNYRTLFVKKFLCSKTQRSVTLEVRVTKASFNVRRAILRPSILLLKLDLKAEAVDGVTLWRLTGTGTIPHRTIRGRAGVVKTGAQRGWTAIT